MLFRIADMRRKVNHVLTKKIKTMNWKVFIYKITICAVGVFLSSCEQDKINFDLDDNSNPFQISVLNADGERTLSSPSAVVGGIATYTDETPEELVESRTWEFFGGAPVEATEPLPDGMRYIIQNEKTVQVRYLRANVEPDGGTSPELGGFDGLLTVRFKDGTRQFRRIKTVVRPKVITEFGILSIEQNSGCIKSIFEEGNSITTMPQTILQGQVVNFTNIINETIQRETGPEDGLRFEWTIEGVDSGDAEILNGELDEKTMTFIQNNRESAPKVKFNSIGNYDVQLKVVRPFTAVDSMTTVIPDLVNVVDVNTEIPVAIDKILFENNKLIITFDGTINPSTFRISDFQINITYIDEVRNGNIIEPTSTTIVSKPTLIRFPAVGNSIEITPEVIRNSLDDKIIELKPRSFSISYTPGTLESCNGFQIVGFEDLGPVRPIIDLFPTGNFEGQTFPLFWNNPNFVNPNGGSVSMNFTEGVDMSRALELSYTNDPTSAAGSFSDGSGTPDEKRARNNFVQLEDGTSEGRLHELKVKLKYTGGRPKSVSISLQPNLPFKGSATIVALDVNSVEDIDRLRTDEFVEFTGLFTATADLLSTSVVQIRLRAFGNGQAGSVIFDDIQVFDIDD